MQTIILIVHVLIGLTLIGLVLIQHGKGADAGAAFGSGSSGTVFGARGAATFLQKLTGWLVVAFFGTSLLLAYVINTSHTPSSVVNSVPVPCAGSNEVPGQNPAAPVNSAPAKPADVPSTPSSESAAPATVEPKQGDIPSGGAPK